MSAATRTTAERWTCDRCGVAVSKLHGERVPLPASWDRSAAGQFCLGCRRERAAEAALDAAPSGSDRDTRAKLRRTGLIEFEVRRAPDHADSEIAKACHSSPAVVRETRRRLESPVGGR